MLLRLTLILLCGVLKFSYVLSLEFKFEKNSSFSVLNQEKLEDFLEILDRRQIYSKKEHLPDYEKMIEVFKNNFEGPVVTIPDFGSARGRIMKSFHKKEFYAFHGIPFAQPPTGNLRFRMPQPYNRKWPQDLRGKEYDATYFRSRCPQLSIITGLASGSEDCLHLNIYTPKNFSSTSQLPVMFFIHGGSFVGGEATFFIPTKLMDRGVIVVVPQYRLGSLGFLAAETPENPGNMGLMDQITALRWIQKYIHYFGGNSSLVTVFGESAGSVSASWMQFTPATTAARNNGTQLFHRLITQSGSALDAWAHDPRPEISFRLQATAVNCLSEENNNSVNEILKCMRQKSVKEIVDGYCKVYLTDRLNGGLGFKGSSLVIQKNLLKNYPKEIEDDPDLLVLPETAFKLLNENKFLKVPVMAGANRDEGSVFLGLIYAEFLEPKNLTQNETYLSEFFLPLMVRDLELPDPLNVVANSLRLSFFKKLRLGNFTQMSPGLIDMIGMIFLKSGVWQMAHLQSIKNQDHGFYFYSFEFESDDSLFHWLFLFDPDVPIKAGVAHGDELIYMFSLPGVMDERQTQTVYRLTTLWANFAHFGDPTPTAYLDKTESQNDTSIPKWSRFTIKNLEYMLIKDDFKVENDFSYRWNYNSLPEYK